MKSLADLYGSSEPEDVQRTPKSEAQAADQPKPVSEVGELPPGAPPEVGLLMTGDSESRQERRDEMSGLNDGNEPEMPYGSRQMSPDAASELRRRMMKAIYMARPLANIPNADAIEYHPGGEPDNVRKRIEQGPRTYSCEQERAAKEGKPEPVSQAPDDPSPILPQPDMSKPGHFQPHESVPYRPGANKPLGKRQKVSRENPMGGGFGG